MRCPSTAEKTREFSGQDAGAWGWILVGKREGRCSRLLEINQRLPKNLLVQFRQKLVGFQENHSVLSEEIAE